MGTSRGKLFALALGIVGLAGAALAARSPVAVSPGDASKLALVEGRCPTFSWGAVEAARSYELVVYRLGGEGEEAREAFRQQFDGSVTSWTPSLDRCLERGGRYAWSVRALGSKQASEWSAPSLFEVAPGPSEVELQVALQIVRQYLADANADLPTERGGRAGAQSENPPSSKTLGPLSPLTPVAGDSALTVNGSPVVTVATLAGALCGSTELRFLDRGDGTVLDCGTSLIWMKKANCSGLLNWDDAVSWASAMSSGSCGLADGSVAGQWRLPTIEEICSAFAGINLVPCPADAAPDSLIDSSVSGSPKVVNGRGDAAWAADDAFIGVLAAEYWSGTERTPGLTAWYGQLDNGRVFYGNHVQTYNVWLVRDAP